MLIHASCVARVGAGILLIGPPGAGKSDLALRLLDHGCDLLADDQVQIDGLTLTPPTTLAGLIEVRGLGMLRLPHIHTAQLALVVAAGHPERLPEPATMHGAPMIVLNMLEASAPAKILRALDCAQGAPMLVGAFAV